MSSSDRLDQNIIRTKLSTPRLGRNFLPRPRLLELLAATASYTLTLVCAPAGYGKTSLLVEWASDLAGASELAAQRLCWLSLDAQDNDPYDFLKYLIASLRLAEPGLGQASSSVLSSFPPPPFQVAIGILVNDLLSLGRTLVIVLDDYQFISNPVIHEGLAFFIEHLPANVHMVIAARSDPPLPLARLRVRNQLLEIRADDLQFTLAETAEWVNQVMGLAIGADDLGRLSERAEGWIAGLQMAALAMRSKPDSSSFVRDFSGSNRYILDYLGQEVLESQPAHIQDFLLKTSILGNLSGELCDAVTGNAGPPGQDILEYLDKANMFLVPLDASRTWYRYHHLFADLLHARLLKQLPQDIPALHRRAAGWYAQNGRTAEAIDHFLAAPDYSAACSLIESQVAQAVGRTSMGAVLEWIHRLPPELVRRHPWLCIAEAWYARFTDDVQKMEPFLQAAEQEMDPGDMSELAGIWRGHIACLRSYLADVQGDLPRTVEMARAALQWLPLEDFDNRNFARYTLARAHFIRGELPEAVRLQTENVQACMGTHSTNIIAPSLGSLSRICRVQGRLRDGMKLLQDGCAYVEECDPRRVTVSGTAFAGQAYILLERNELAAAAELAMRSLELCERWLSPTAIGGSYCLLVRVSLAQGNLPAAAEALRCAEQITRGRYPHAEVWSELNAVRARYWLAAGRIAEAAQWAAGQLAGSTQQVPFSIPAEQDAITLARILVAQGSTELAIQRLAPMAESAEVGGRSGSLIEIQILQAVALQGRRDLPRALAVLQNSLALAEPEGYLRTFIDAGQPLWKLLDAYVQSSSPLHRSYAELILAAVAKAHPEALAGQSLTPGVEPLTARELDILRLLVEGLSNRQISETLVLSEGTVKFHVHNILVKMGVHSRAEAIVRAGKENWL